jgi:LPXTG-motif cell wall-anchored protein
MPRKSRFAGRTAVMLITVAFALLVTGGPAEAASHSVTAANFSFSPSTLTIDVGDSVTWTNNAVETPHTSTSDNGAWDSGTINPGQSFTHTFSTAGTFPYHCAFHQAQGMVGTIVVRGSTPTPSGGGSGSGPPITAEPGLPNTGSSTVLPFLWLGVAFVVAGLAVLYGMRRRA